MPNPVLSNHDAPAASAGWWEQFSELVRRRPKAVEDRLFDEFIKDLKLFPTDPDRATTCRKLARSGAQALARPVIIFLLLWGLALVGMPAPVQAMEIDDQPGSLPRVYCDDTERLAALVCMEGCYQEWEARVAIVEIIVREAAQRGMSVCDLSERTHFLSVVHYANAHPGSWHARQLHEVRDWAWDLARAALAGELPDLTQGAGHFDGKACAKPVMQIGGVYFCE